MSIANRFVAIAILIGFLFSFFALPFNLRADATQAFRVCSYSYTALQSDMIQCKYLPGSQDTVSKYNLDSLANGSLKPLNQRGKIHDLVIMTGEKSVVAGKGKYMSMGIAELPDGTLVPDGHEVDFLLGDNSIVKAKTVGGVAHYRFNAPKSAGYIEVSGRAGDVTTVPNTVRVVPAEPLRVSASQKTKTGRRSDDRQIWFNSEPLADAYGNTLADGSFVQFSGKDAQGRQLFLNAIAVNGIASTKFIQREMAGTLQLSAQHKDIIGQAIDFTLPPLELNLDVPVKGEILGSQVKLQIGPLRHSRGAFVADGLEVELELPDGRSHRSQTLDGVAQFEFSLPDLSAGKAITIRSNAYIWTLVLSESILETRAAALDEGIVQ